MSLSSLQLPTILLLVIGSKIALKNFSPTEMYFGRF